MIKYLVNVVAPLGANCYTVYDESTKNCLIIDLGGDFPIVMGRIKRMGLNPKAILLTHGHFDHFQGAVYAKEEGIPIYISQQDEALLSSRANLSEPFGYGELYLSADCILKNGKNQIGGFDVEVIPTPGHTAGSVCFLIDGKLYSGDTLFCRSFGRFDFPTGNFNQLKKSITEVLFSLGDEMEVLPGHEGKTTIGYERKYNPINDYNY